MKNKGRTSSTGHDTGATYRRGLSAILEDTKVRKGQRRLRKLERQAELLMRRYPQFVQMVPKEETK